MFVEDSERRKMAEEFAKHTGTDVEAWMLWGGWDPKMGIGCEYCFEQGPEADCWGYAGCHGYYRGCGCKSCTERDREEEEKELKKLERGS